MITKQTTNGTGERDRVDALSQYPEQLRALQAHVAVAGGAALITFFVNLAINASAGILGEFSAWWSIWAFIGTGVGVAVHGFVVWLNRPTEISS